MIFLQQLHLVVSSWYWLLFILLCFLGLLGWLTYMAVHQYRLTKVMVTRAEFAKAFDEFRKEIQQGTR